MFKFTITNNATSAQNNFFNEKDVLGVKDAYRFLSWIGLSGFQLTLPEIHLLLKTGACGEYTLVITPCDVLSDLIV